MPTMPTWLTADSGALLGSWNVSASGLSGTAAVTHTARKTANVEERLRVVTHYLRGESIY